MENNYENMRMPELKALAKRTNLRCYSRLRKADLIDFLRRSLREDEPQPAIDESLEQPKRNDNKLSKALGFAQPPVGALTKRQRKHRSNKASKLSKKSKNLRIEINDLKSQKDDIEDKINKASRSTSSRFK